MGVIDRIGIEHPVVQAGMGGGIATGTLAGAVSAAGGLGTAADTRRALDAKTALRIQSVVPAAVAVRELVGVP